MRLSQADLGITATVAVLACAAASRAAPLAVTAVLGLALVAAPGYLLGQLLLGSQTAGLERLAVAAGLSLCVPILGGLLLAAAGLPLRRAEWLFLLAGVTLVCDVALFLRRRGAPPAVPGHQPERWRLPIRHAVAFGAAVVIAGGAVGLARAGVALQHYPGYTQLWLDRPNSNSLTVNLGVGNDEGRTVGYLVVLWDNGHPAAIWKFTLANGQTWHQSPRYSDRYPILVKLYRLPDVTSAYRYVTLGGDKTP
jgi:uncharacterized membrane protein